MTLKAGTRLGPYEAAQIGAGGMGRYQARDTTNRHVVLKILPELFGPTPTAGPVQACAGARVRIIPPSRRLRL